MCLQNIRELTKTDPKVWYGYVIQRKVGKQYSGLWYSECGTCRLGEEKFYDPLVIPNIERMRICGNDKKGFYGYTKLCYARNTRSYILEDVLRDKTVILLAEFRSLRDIGHPFLSISNPKSLKRIADRVSERTMISFRAKYRTLLCEIK